MPQFKCSCCNKACEDHKIITCCVCKANYLHSCVDLTVAELRSLKSKKNLNWSCQDCLQVGDNINDLKALIMSLRKEIESLKSIKTASVCECNSAVDFEAIVQEISDRNARKNNLIFYGMPESLSTDHNVRILHDQQQVSKVLNFVLPESGSDLSAKPIRLGKFDAAKSNPRPLKITLPSEHAVLNIIRRAFKLKDLRDPKDIRISLDKTPRQQQYYRKLRDELSMRTAEGESNLRIKYIRGVPQIISSN